MVIIKMKSIILNIVAIILYFIIAVAIVKSSIEPETTIWYLLSLMFLINYNWNHISKG